MAGKVRGAVCRLLGASLVLGGAGCGPRPVVIEPRSVAAAPPYEEAVASLTAAVDTVTVQGQISLEDRAPVPDGAQVSVTSTLGFERRMVGGVWEPDVERTLVLQDTAGVRSGGQYRLRVPALCARRPAEEVAFQDSTGHRGFVRFSDYAGLKLGGWGAGATAREVVISQVEPENYLDFTLRYETTRAFTLAESTAVYGEPSAEGKPLTALPFASLVNLIRRDGAWARVRHGVGMFGWVAGAEVGDSDALQQAREAREARYRRDIDRRGFPAAMADALKLRQVIPGMTREMVRLAWGPPDREEEMTTEGAGRSRWLYLPRADRGSRQVIFDGPRVLRVSED